MMTQFSFYRRELVSLLVFATCGLVFFKWNTPAFDYPSDKLTQQQRMDLPLKEDWEDVLVEDQSGDVFKQRRDHLKKVCEKFSAPFKAEYFPLYGRDTEQSRVTKRYFKLKNQTNLLIMMPKVATTSWTQFFLDNHITGLDCVGEGCFERDQINVIIQIRHPLERLLSAYRFLILEEGWKFIYHHNKLNVRDFETFTDKSMNLTWPGFVDSVLNNSHFLGEFDLKTMYEAWNRGHDTNFNYRAVFVMHYCPYWLLVSPCRDKFTPDVILKLETMDSDFPRLLPLLGLPQDTVFHRLIPAVVAENPGATEKDHKTSQFVHDTTFNTLQKYFSQISKKKVYQLYQMYKLDFQLYGYSPQKFLDYAY